jgi:aminopeptidase N
MRAFFKGFDRERISRDAYLALATTDSEVPLMRHGDQYPYGTEAYSVASYDKMATNMVALRALLGDEAFLSSYRTYGLRWLYKHPAQYDFFNSFNSLSGKDLSWFWRTWWYETWTLDQAVASVVSTNGTTTITVDDRGLAPMPVRLAITRSDGRVERRVIPVDVWLAGARQYTLTLDAAPPITSVEIDPEHVFPDVDRSNNRWPKQ